MRKQDILEYENGATYVGETVGKNRDGVGVYSQNGISISGTWKDNHLNGIGEMISPNFTYKGEFVDTVRQGFGVEKTVDGNIYEGEFFAGRKHGKMKITLSNGATIDCVFVNGVGVGDGVMTMSDGEKVAVEFINGQLFFKK